VVVPDVAPQRNRNYYEKESSMALEKEARKEVGDDCSAEKCGLAKEPLSLFLCGKDCHRSLQNI
jgi:hypothetical protein